MAVVRQRRYVVTDVRTGVTGAEIAERPQQLVSLTSIEDGALGEELRVIWEIEPGARAFEKMELPEPKGFDQPAHLEAFLDAVRRGAASIADTRQLQSPLSGRDGPRRGRRRRSLSGGSRDRRAPRSGPRSPTAQRVRKTRERPRPRELLNPAGTRLGPTVD